MIQAVEDSGYKDIAYYLDMLNRGTSKIKVADNVMKGLSTKVSPAVTKPTQKEQVKEVVAEEPKSIKEVSEITGILEPNVRRILGVGAKDGTFSRVDDGVYILKKFG